LATSGPGATPAGRDVCVLGEPHGLEAALLEGAGQLVGGDRVLGGKHDDAVVHGDLLGLRRQAYASFALTVQPGWVSVWGSCTPRSASGRLPSSRAASAPGRSPSPKSCRRTSRRSSVSIPG